MTLRDQQILFAKLLPELIEQAFALGYDVVLGEVYRTPEQAALNAERGTGIRDSLHCYRLAIDLLLFRSGVWLQTSSDYEPLGAWWEQRHVLARWGGRFQRPDGGHFSLEWEGRK